jgi:hypothetical protein
VSGRVPWGISVTIRTGEGRQCASIKWLQQSYLNYQHWGVNGLQHLSGQGYSLQKKYRTREKPGGCDTREGGKSTDIFDQIQVLNGQ